MNCLTVYCAVYQMRKIKMKCSPTFVLQLSHCINMQIYQQTLCQISLWAIKLHSCTSQMNSRHKSSKLNQSVMCFTISSNSFDFKCLIVSKQTQRIPEMMSPSNGFQSKSNISGGIESSLLFSQIKLIHCPATSQ